MSTDSPVAITRSYDTTNAYRELDHLGLREVLEQEENDAEETLGINAWEVFIGGRTATFMLAERQARERAEKNSVAQDHQSQTSFNVNVPVSFTNVIYIRNVYNFSPLLVILL